MGKKKYILIPHPPQKERSPSSPLHPQREKRTPMHPPSYPPTRKCIRPSYLTLPTSQNFHPHSSHKYSYNKNPQASISNLSPSPYWRIPSQLSRNTRRTHLESLSLSLSSFAFRTTFLFFLGFFLFFFFFLLCRSTSFFFSAFIFFAEGFGFEFVPIAFEGF